MAGEIIVPKQACATRILPAEDHPENPQFLHSILAQCGLPRRKLPVEQRDFMRENGKYTLVIEAGILPGDRAAGESKINLPVPSGTRPRLVMIHACSEAVRTKSPVIDLEGSLSAFLRRLRIDTGGKTMRDFRWQTTALARCHMSVVDRTDPDKTKHVTMSIIDEFSSRPAGSRDKHEPWPAELRLADKFFMHLGQHAVPLDPAAIASLQNSALALDVYSWLAQRLLRIKSPNGELLKWPTLQDQFGQEYSTLRSFKQDILRAIGRARAAYPDARLELETNGLRMFRSNPPWPDRLKQVMLPAAMPKVLPAPGSHLPEPAPASATAGGMGVQGLEMTDALKLLLRRAAPGWDTHRLLELFRAWMVDKPTPADPTKACAGWAKSFTKGKPPA